MTILVGVQCTDGIVIGADSIATSAAGSHPLIHVQSNSKITLFPSSVIVAATGAVGMSQRLMHHVEAAIAGGVFKGGLSLNDCITNISKRALTDFSNSMVQNHPGSGLQFGALMAAVIKGQPYLVEYGSTDFQPEIKKDKLFFVSMGSGQILADPFLAFVSRVLWKNEMPCLEDGKFGVYWALSHTIKLAPGGVGGDIKIAVLRKSTAGWVAEEVKDTQEQSQYIDELEAYIGKFARNTIDTAEGIPLPTPP